MNLREPPSRACQIRIICDCKVKIEDDFLVEKLRKLVKKLKHKTGKSWKIKASLKNSPRPNREKRELVRFLLTIFPIISLFYVILDNLFYRRAYLFRIRKTIEMTKELEEWLVD